MADSFDKEERSRIMALVKSKDTSPEMKVRKAIHRAGHRFRLHRSDLPGSPDLVFPRYRMAVFVHGCFWHWHGCRRARMPKTNREYWQAKIQRNMDRDVKTQAQLTGLGWRAISIWECSLESGISELLNHLDESRTKLALS